MGNEGVKVMRNRQGIPESLTPPVLRNKAVFDDDRVDSCVLPIGDGLSLALKR